MNDSQLPLRCKKGEGYRMAAGDFVGYNQEPGAAPRLNPGQGYSSDPSYYFTPAVTGPTKGSASPGRVCH